MGITTKTDEKILSELKLMVQVGATPVECVKALNGKMSHSSVYKFYNRFKIQAHHKAIDNAKEEKAVNIPNEVVKEPVSKNEQFEESAHIINELSGKNEELQKELHTQKVVIETLQKGVNELNEAITESKIMIAEIAKERDDKDEEIRVLSLELQELKNKYDSLEECNTENWSLMNDFENELIEISKSKSEETGSIADFREITEEMIQLYIKKNKDYGNAFNQSYGEFGSVMCAIRINDKLNRFKTLIKQNNEVKTESIKDTLIDLANYAVMTIIEIEREKNRREENNER